MLLTELYDREESKHMVHAGYKLRHETEDEFDDEGKKENSKLWHHITAPGSNKEETLDHSPYQRITSNALKAYADFHQKHGRFPTRKDTKSIGPLDNDEVVRLAK